MDLKKLEKKISKYLQANPVERIPGIPEPETTFQAISCENLPDGNGICVHGQYKIGGISMDATFSTDAEWKEWSLDYGGGVDDLELLEKKVKELREKKFAVYQGKEILGFKLARNQKSSTQKGKKYVSQKWQAYCFVDGKQITIHLGDDPRIAQAKIQEYLASHAKLREALPAKQS